MIVYTLHEAYDHEGSTFVGAFSSFDAAVEYLVQSLDWSGQEEHNIIWPDQIIICKSEVDGTKKDTMDDKQLFSISREQMYKLFASEEQPSKLMSINHKTKCLFNLEKDINIISPVIKHIMTRVNLPCCSHEV